DHVLCRGGDRRYRIDTRRLSGSDAGGCGRDLWPSTVPRCRRDFGLCADGDHSVVQARRAVQAGISIHMNYANKLIPIVVLLALAVFPLTGSASYTGLAIKFMIYAIFALSLQLLVGGAGLISLGHAAFFGIGAYCAALLS